MLMMWAAGCQEDGSREVLLRFQLMVGLSVRLSSASVLGALSEVVPLATAPKPEDKDEDKDMSAAAASPNPLCFSTIEYEFEEDEGGKREDDAEGVDEEER